MDFSLNKIIKVLLLSLPYFCVTPLATAADSQEGEIQADIVVLGKKLDNSLDSGDYYMIGYYHGLIKKREWELKQARQGNSSNSGQSSNQNDESEENSNEETPNIDKCVQTQNAKLAFCRKQSQERYTERQKNCSTVIAIMNHLPGGSGSYTRCHHNAQAVLQEDLAECQFVAEFGKAKCHN